jgi:hypothetical protein
LLDLCENRGSAKTLRLVDIPSENPLLPNSEQTRR